MKKINIFSSQGKLKKKKLTYFFQVFFNWCFLKKKLLRNLLISIYLFSFSPINKKFIKV